jgi:hypothetical protein
VKALKSALLTLRSGPSCAQRKASIPKIVALHDVNAIPDLKRARGLAGNACLRASANDAIRKISN